MEVPGEGGEEDGERHDEAAHDGRQARRLAPAQRHQERGHGVRHGQVGGPQPHWNRQERLQARCMRCVQTRYESRKMIGFQSKKGVRLNS